MIDSVCNVIGSGYRRVSAASEALIAVTRVGVLSDVVAAIEREHVRFGKEGYSYGDARVVFERAKVISDFFVRSLKSDNGVFDSQLKEMLLSREYERLKADCCDRAREGAPLILENELDFPYNTIREK